jgi:molybdenum cofactor biosynthesis enzyme MoaA/iron-sulfur cluster repair protein YtfE (RIC family)
MPAPRTPSDVAALARSILDTHHALLKRELPLLEAGLRDADAAVRVPFGKLVRVLNEHLMKEEAILFPAILALAEGHAVDGCGVHGPIAQMQAEHEVIRALEEELRVERARAGTLGPDLLRLLDDLAEHARKEDEWLFPAAIRLAEAADGARAATNEAARLEPAPPPRRKHVPPDARPVTPPPGGRVLRQTRGMCPTCHTEVPGSVVLRDGKALLEKRCPTHGTTTQLLSKHPDLWSELDRFYFSVNDRSHPQRDFIVRMTERCNLACPICLAKANTEDTPDLDLAGLEKLLSERRGIKIDLMAAEPTLREDLLDWVRKVKATGNIAALHTNGLKLADADYVRALAEAGVDEVFLQFDGLDDAANAALRGRPLLKARQAALANLRAHNIATSLIVVIARDLNEDQVGATFRFALAPENAHVREVFFLGLRSMGSARHTGVLGGQQLMPDELIDRLCEQVPQVRRRDVHAFNMLYFAMLSAFQVKKCLYVQHYLVARDGSGGFTPIGDILDLKRLTAAAVHYAHRRKVHEGLARAGLLAALLREGLSPTVMRMALDLFQLERLFASGMNLRHVPERFLLVGFITACDLDNFDAAVSVNCGKGELSVDGGFTESSAVANVRREARFARNAREPGAPATSSVRAGRA